MYKSLLYKYIHVQVQKLYEQEFPICHVQSDSIFSSVDRRLWETSLFVISNNSAEHLWRVQMLVMEKQILASIAEVPSTSKQVVA